MNIDQRGPAIESLVVSNDFDVLKLCDHRSLCVRSVARKFARLDFACDYHNDVPTKVPQPLAQGLTKPRRTIRGAMQRPALSPRPHGISASAPRHSSLLLTTSRPMAMSARLAATTPTGSESELSLRSALSTQDPERGPSTQKRFVKVTRRSANTTVICRSGCHMEVQS